MARKTTSSNGHSRLDEAITLLVQTQAAFVSQLAESDRRLSENERLHIQNERLHLKFEREAAERFTRIEAQMAQIISVLAEHGRILERLPDAVRDKIGFKA